MRAKTGAIDCSPSSSTADTDGNGKLSADFIEKCTHVNSIVHFLSNERRLIPNKQFQTEAIESVLSAVQKNPYWNLRLLDATYTDTINLSEVTYVMSKVGSKPIVCRMRELLHFLYVRIVMFACLAVTLVLAWLLFKAVNRMNAEKDKEFFAMVGQVTQLVEKQYELSLTSGGGGSDYSSQVKPYLATAHIYDTLVEPSQRAGKRKLWAKVVKFIQDHESRIHQETQLIDGEEILVWKWVVPKHVGQVAQQHQQQQHVDSSTMGMNMNNNGKFGF